jgi:hypothetical protein
MTNFTEARSVRAERASLVLPHCSAARGAKMTDAPKVPSQKLEEGNQCSTPPRPMI